MPGAADCASWPIFSIGHVFTLSHGIELASCLLSPFESKLIRSVVKELFYFTDLCLKNRQKSCAKGQISALGYPVG